MEYRVLGKTGIRVSRLCLGTMSFGGEADETASAAMYHRCRGLGINFFDCANVYAGGRSEEVLGELIKGEYTASPSRIRVAGLTVMNAMASWLGSKFKGDIHASVVQTSISNALFHLERWIP